MRVFDHVPANPTRAFRADRPRTALARPASSRYWGNPVAVDSADGLLLRRSQRGTAGRHRVPLKLCRIFRASPSPTVARSIRRRGGPCARPLYPPKPNTALRTPPYRAEARNAYRHLLAGCPSAPTGMICQEHDGGRRAYYKSSASRHCWPAQAVRALSRGCSSAREPS